MLDVLRCSLTPSSPPASNLCAMFSWLEVVQDVANAILRKVTKAAGRWCKHECRGTSQPTARWEARYTQTQHVPSCSAPKRR